MFVLLLGWRETNVLFVAPWDDHLAQGGTVRTFGSFPLWLLWRMLGVKSVSAAKREVRILHCFVPWSQPLWVTGNIKHCLFFLFTDCTSKQHNSNLSSFAVLGLWSLAISPKRRRYDARWAVGAISWSAYKTPFQEHNDCPSHPTPRFDVKRHWITLDCASHQQLRTCLCVLPKQCGIRGAYASRRYVCPCYRL